MGIFSKIKSFVKPSDTPTETDMLGCETASELEDTIEACLDELNAENEERIRIEKRTLLSKISGIRQSASIYVQTYPELEQYIQQLDQLTERYKVALDESSKDLTLELNPEVNGTLRSTIYAVEKAVNKYIAQVVKPTETIKRYNHFIVKVSESLNTSSFYGITDQSIRKNAMRQLVSCKSKRLELCQCVKDVLADYPDKQVEEKFIQLVTYADFLMSKIEILNSEQYSTLDVLEEYQKTSVFDVDYIGIFKNYVIDELQSLVIDNSKFDEERKMILLKHNSNPNLFDMFFDFERRLKAYQISIGKKREETCIDLPDWIDTSNRDSMYLSKKEIALKKLNKLLSENQMLECIPVIRIVSNIGKETISSKEVRFLLELFGITYEDTKVEKMQKFKQRVMNYGKSYVFVFEASEKEKFIFKILDDNDIDYIVEDGTHVLMRAEYFLNMKGLNV